MALNLVRNSRVFFTTNVNANTGVINNTGFTPANTFEVQVLDGLTFSQATANESVSVSEAGGDPVRGTRTFNTSVEAASFSFSTYLRPDFLSSTPVCEESVLWSAFSGDQNQFASSATSITGVTAGGATYNGSTGQLTLAGTAMPVSTLKPNMICYLANPFSALTIGSALSAAQLAGFGGLVRIVSASATSIVLEYLQKPNTTNSTSATVATTVSLTLPNGSVLTGTPSYAYSATTNQLTITGVSNFASFTVGTYYVFKNLAGTSGALFNNIPAKVTSSSSASSGTVIFEFSQSAVNASAVANADITSTDAYLLRTSWVPSTGSGANSFMTLMNSNKNQLIKSGYLFVVDQVTYALDNAVLTEVSIDFGIDAIATASWSGQATSLRQFSTNFAASSISASVGGFSGTVTSATGTDSTYANAYTELYTPKNTSSDFLTNKLSTCTLKAKKALTNAAGTTVISADDSYTVPLTGGSITLSNNVTYLTPAVLAVVNQPINYFTGNRSITGSMTAYLKTGITRSTTGNATGNLLNDFLKVASTTVEPYFEISLAINGSGQSNRVVLDLPNASIGIPAIDVQQVVSTTINFTGQATTGATTPTYDIEGINDIFIRYYAA